VLATVGDEAVAFTSVPAVLVQVVAEFSKVELEQRLFAGWASAVRGISWKTSRNPKRANKGRGSNFLLIDGWMDLT
jgi:hypothetical protein